jgi:hypothetical protein
MFPTIKNPFSRSQNVETEALLEDEETFKQNVSGIPSLERILSSTKIFFRSDSYAHKTEYPFAFENFVNQDSNDVIVDKDQLDRFNEALKVGANETNLESINTFSPANENVSTQTGNMPSLVDIEPLVAQIPKSMPIRIADSIKKVFSREGQNNSLEEIENFAQENCEKHNRSLNPGPSLFTRIKGAVFSYEEKFKLSTQTLKPIDNQSESDFGEAQYLLENVKSDSFNTFAQEKLNQKKALFPRITDGPSSYDEKFKLSTQTLKPNVNQTYDFACSSEDYEEISDPSSGESDMGKQEIKPELDVEHAFSLAPQPSLIPPTIDATPKSSQQVVQDQEQNPSEINLDVDNAFNNPNPFENAELQSSWKQAKKIDKKPVMNLSTQRVGERKQTDKKPAINSGVDGTKKPEEKNNSLKQVLVISGIVLGILAVLGGVLAIMNYMGPPSIHEFFVRPISVGDALLKIGLPTLGGIIIVSTVSAVAYRKYHQKKA